MHNYKWPIVNRSRYKLFKFWWYLVLLIFYDFFCKKNQPCLVLIYRFSYLVLFKNKEEKNKLTKKKVSIICPILPYKSYQMRTGHKTRWEKSNGAPLVWEPPSIMACFFFRSAEIWKFSVWAAAMALYSSYLMSFFFFLGQQVCFVWQ
jgi:hypothetical protein